MFRPPRQFLYLDAVARNGSIRKAASAIGVSSTSINRMILEMEAELGAPVFERLPKGVRLTAAGEVLIAVIRKNITDIKQANAQIEQLRGLVSGHIKLAVAHSIASYLIAPLIAEYQRRHPKVKFELMAGGTLDLIAALERDDVDLAFVHDPPRSDSLTRLAAYPEPLCAMMPPGHPLARKTKLKLADCVPYPIALGGMSFGGRMLIDQIVGRLGLTLNVVMVSHDFQAKVAFARHAGAICFQFRIGTMEDVASGRMVAIPLEDPETSNGQLVLMHRSGRNLPLAAVSFAEAIKEKMSHL